MLQVSDCYLFCTLAWWFCTNNHKRFLALPFANMPQLVAAPGHHHASYLTLWRVCLHLHTLRCFINSKSSISLACRLDVPLTTPAGLVASSEGSVSCPKHIVKMDVDSLAKYFTHPSSDQQAAPSNEVQPDRPIVAAPRDFLKAAMRAREQVILAPKQQYTEVLHMLYNLSLKKHGSAS